mgnify:CR=1 FL=1
MILVDTNKFENLSDLVTELHRVASQDEIAYLTIDKTILMLVPQSIIVGAIQTSLLQNLKKLESFGEIPKI